MTQQYFPSAWNEAAVIFVFKRGNHAALINYRPISLLSNFSKLFEFIIMFRFTLNLITINMASSEPNLQLPIW
jgi:hypothetical protein